MAKKVTYVVGDNLGTPIVTEHVVEEKPVKSPKPSPHSPSKMNTKGKKTSSKKYFSKGIRNK